MRTVTNSAITINYPDDLVFSGDLNRISIVKNTTATHVEISFTIGGYTYVENLYFLTSTIDFSMAEILKLLYTRTFNTAFTPVLGFSFTVKLYNNTSLIDTNSLSINLVFLGKRRIFDKLGAIPNIIDTDYDPSIGLTEMYYFFPVATYVYAKLMDGTVVFVESIIGYKQFNLVGLEASIGEVEYLILSTSVFDPTFDLTFRSTDIFELNRDCSSSVLGTKIGLRFLNRFGFWRSYYVVRKTESISSENGISLWFLENNLTEFNNTFAEQNKKYTQSVSVFRDSVSKEAANEFSDIIYSDHVHLYDEINSCWIPIKVNTNSFNISEKENLFDISLNLLLQSNNE